MKIGILGTGFGAYHAEIYNKLPGAEVLGIFGRKEEKLKKIESDLKIKGTNNIQDIITNQEIELIDICLPSSLHREYAVAAMKSGKNVFIETPAALSLEDAIAIQKAAREYDKKAFVNLFIRCEPSYEYLHDLIQKNTLGTSGERHLIYGRI